MGLFFDLVGWDYEYEPSQLNSYNPDFIIKCNSDAYACKFIIVEVKPEIMIDEKYIEQVYRKYYLIPAHILILSDFPFRKSKVDFNSNCISIGIGSQYLASKNGLERTEMVDFEMKCIDDFGSTLMMFDGMIKGEVHRKIFLELGFDGNEIDKLINIWAISGNKTMFKK